MLVEIILLGFRSAAGRAANGRMRVAHVLAKFGAKEVVTATGSSGGYTVREAGSRTSRPIMAMLGLIPVTECGVMRYAANSAGRRSGHDSGCASNSALGLAIRPWVKRRGPRFIYACDRAKFGYQLAIKIASLVAM